jgi:hypothetical protein
MTLERGVFWAELARDFYIQGVSTTGGPKDRRVMEKDEEKAEKSELKTGSCCARW